MKSLYYEIKAQEVIEEINDFSLHNLISKAETGPKSALVDLAKKLRCVREDISLSPELCHRLADAIDPSMRKKDGRPKKELEDKLLCSIYLQFTNGDDEFITACNIKRTFECVLTFINENREEDNQISMDKLKRAVKKFKNKL